MAIKLYITDIKNIIDAGLVNDEKLSDIRTRLGLILTLTDLVLKTQSKLNKLALLNRLKYEKTAGLLHDLSYVKSLLLHAKVELLKLSQYRKKAIELKQDYNNRIKTLFDIKLSNQTAKDYNTYKKLYSKFDFEHVDDEAILDENKKTYELLDWAGTFGNDKLSDVKALPNPKGTDKKVETNNWRTKLKQQ